MSTDASAWAWVAAAWMQLVIAYVGYLAYLRRRAHRTQDDDEARS